MTVIPAQLYLRTPNGQARAWTEGNVIDGKSITALWNAAIVQSNGRNSFSRLGIDTNVSVAPGRVCKISV